MVLSGKNQGGSGLCGSEVEGQQVLAMELGTGLHFVQHLQLCG